MKTLSSFAALLLSAVVGCLSATAAEEQAPAVPLPSASPEAAPSRPSPGTLRMLQELELARAGDKTFHVSFKQVRRDEAFEEDILSSGEMWFARGKEGEDKFRVDYADPTPEIIIITPEAVWDYIAEMSQVDYYQFEDPVQYRQQMETILLGFGSSVEQLVERYEMQASADEAPAAAELKQMGLDPQTRALLLVRPRPKYLETSPFKEMKLVVDKATQLPEKIWYLDPQENPVTIQIERVERNVEIDARMFSPRAAIPAEAKYINKREVQ